jgi:hypothetical protein
MNLLITTERVVEPGHGDSLGSLLAQNTPLSRRRVIGKTHHLIESVSSWLEPLDKRPTLPHAEQPQR